MDKTNWSRQVAFALWAVVRRRCPKCGRGAAFDGLWRMKPACPACGRRFQQHPGSTTGVMQVGAMAVVIFAIITWFIIAAVLDRPLDTQLAVLLAITVIFGLWFYPYARLLWEALDCVLDEMNDEGPSR